MYINAYYVHHTVVCASTGHGSYDVPPKCAYECARVRVHIQYTRHNPILGRSPPGKRTDVDDSHACRRRPSNKKKTNLVYTSCTLPARRAVPVPSSYRMLIRTYTYCRYGRVRVFAARAQCTRTRIMCARPASC